MNIRSLPVVAEPTPPAIHALDTGDRVRSFDFPSYYPKLGVDGLDLDGERACYVEGEIVGFIGLDFDLDVDGTTFGPTQDCERYVIRVTRIVRRGETVEQPGRDFICPPINGTPGSLGGTTFGVQPMGWSLEDTQQAVTEAACDWQGAEEQIEDAHYALQQAQDRVNALVDRQASAAEYAEYAVAQADALDRDEAGEVFNDCFGYYPPEAS